jgi:hypothetical protein
MGGKPKQYVVNTIRKWVEDKQNVIVVQRTNNQEPTPGPSHERKHARIIFEG